MEIITIPISELHAYENNPRCNDGAVQTVANSIQEFGFRVPVLVDQNRVIIAGHTRVKAAAQLSMDAIPCVIIDDLTEEQIQAFRIVDNKTSELSGWDFERLSQELEDLADIDWSAFGFVDADEEALFADTEEKPLEETYREPEVAKLRCPQCGHVDSKVRFQPA